MIINNYNTSLEENKETDLTFLSVNNPQIFIRNFKSRIYYNEKLIIPYYVTDHHRGHYWLDSDESRNVKDSTPVSTFTAILRIDEFGNNPIEVKQTTFAGKYFFEIGPFSKDFVGVHNMSLQCIQSNGVSSASNPYHLLVEDPNEETVTLDLTKVNSFSSHLTSDNINNEESVDGLGTPTNMSTKYIRSTDAKRCVSGAWTAINIVEKRTIVADYNVQVVKGSNNKVQRIQIAVSGDNPSNNVNYPGGYSYYWSVTNWTKYKTGDGLALKKFIPRKVNIKGNYVLTTVAYDEQGREHNLIDYLDKQPVGKRVTEAQNQLPDFIRVAAIKNKIALTRLCEAAKAYGNGKKVILKLPKIPIVVDRHIMWSNEYSYFTNVEGLQWQDSIYNEGETIVTEDYLPTPAQSFINISNDVGQYFYKNTYILEFPDDFTLDLGGSTVYVLQSTDVEGGTIVSIRSNINTHIKNGKIFGSHKYLQYKNQYQFPEHLSNVSILNSWFCTFDNVDIAYSTGYDAYIGGQDGALNAKDKFDYYFDKCGYIDYDGNFNLLKEDPLKNSINLYCNKQSGINHKCFRTQYQHIDRSFLKIAKNNGSETGLRTRLINRECFLHFFKNANQTGNPNEPTNNLTYLCTKKVFDSDSFFYPKDTHTIFMSAYGINNNGEKIKNYMDSLNMKTLSAGRGGAFVIDNSSYSFGSGYVNCRIYNERSCIMDWVMCNCCFIENCLFANLACERDDDQGGWSDQTQMVDQEDGCFDANNIWLKDCENIYGRGGFYVHVSTNLGIVNCRGFNIWLEKGEYGGFLENSFFDKINIGHGFSVPIRFETIVNTTCSQFDNSCTKVGKYGDTKVLGYILLEHSTIGHFTQSHWGGELKDPYDLLSKIYTYQSTYYNINTDINDDTTGT